MNIHVYQKQISKRHFKTKSVSFFSKRSHEKGQKKGIKRIQGAIGGGGRK
jgi:hypothetical protein